MIMYNAPLGKDSKRAKELKKEKARIRSSKYFYAIDNLGKEFKSSKKFFYLNNSFDSTIVFEKLLDRFKNLFNEDINNIDFLMSIIQLYKELVVKAAYYQRPEMQINVEVSDDTDFFYD